MARSPARQLAGCPGAISARQAARNGAVARSPARGLTPQKCKKPVENLRDRRLVLMHACNVSGTQCDALHHCKQQRNLWRLLEALSISISLRKNDIVHKLRGTCFADFRARRRACA